MKISMRKHRGSGSHSLNFHGHGRPMQVCGNVHEYQLLNLEYASWFGDNNFDVASVPRALIFDWNLKLDVRQFPHRSTFE